MRFSAADDILRVSVRNVPQNPVLGAIQVNLMVALEEKKKALRGQGKRLFDFGLGDPKEPTPTFLRDAVERYGPGGEFWREHRSGADFLPELPLREWQIWNEANFFYFATPASPQRYAKLLKITSPAIKRVEPNARVILSGLFGDPTANPPNAMPAVQFLEQLYRVPGIKADFDGVALHPYADKAERLEELVEEMRAVVLENHDPSTRLYITEMGWGSQNDPNVVAFEQGIAGQARELRKAYSFLIANRARLNLKAAYWYSWKDNPEYVACSFCDSVGLFRAGRAFKPKPAWRAFVALTGGRARP